jgi:(p)ppGpp synthase/HD superfamily hydrolase
MRSFALTYPQLMNQAIAVALDTEALVRLRATYELGERLADGVYRPQGEPFLCHLVRTASIVLAEGQPLPVVQAALLHAAYSLRRRVGDANSRGSRRAWLQKAAGPEVEQLVFAYDQLPWNASAQLKRHVEGFARYDQTTRRVVLLRLANELEDHLDRSAAYASADLVRRRQERRDGCLTLARAAGSPAFVSELTEVFDRQLDPPLPLEVVMGRNQGYTLQGKRWPELSRLRETMRCLMRRMRHRSR